MTGKLITFDGRSGSGKTTQSEKIAELLGMKCMSFFEMYRTIVGLRDALVSNDNNSDGSGFLVLQHLAMVRGLFDGRTTWSRHPKGVVIDGGMFSVLPLFNQEGEIDMRYEHQRSDINLFRQCLSFRGGIEPEASFYLRVDPETTVERVVGRISGHPTTNEPIALEAGTKEAIVRQEGTWDFRAAEIPYLHIIDASGSEEATTKRILSILETEGIINADDLA